MKECKYCRTKYDDNLSACPSCGGTKVITAQEKAEEEAFMAEEMKKLQKRYQQEKEEIHTRFVAERKVGYGA